MIGSERTARAATTGDAAVDGLGAGIVGGIAMAIYLVVVGLVASGEPGTILAHIDLGARDQGAQPSALSGLLVHLAVAGVYGTLFGLITRLVPYLWRQQRRGAVTIAGAVYGLILLGLAQTVILRGIDSMLIGVPLAHLVVAHAIYGLIVGTFVGRTIGPSRPDR